MKTFPLLSVIIPCFNEVDHIQRCLDGVLAMDYDLKNLEVLVLDGMSVDGTRDIVKRVAKQYPFIRLIDNPKRYQSFAMNRGIDESRGNYFVRIDARVTLSKNYFSACVDYLEKNDAACVGGLNESRPQSDTVFGRSCSYVSSTPLGVGPGYKTKAAAKAPFAVDTVPYACYRKEAVQRIGKFNPLLICAEDLDLNMRLNQSGYKVMTLPTIKSTYYVRSQFKDFVRHAFRDGQWVILPYLYTKRIIIRLKHIVPLLFVLTLAATLAASIWAHAALLLFLSVLSLYLSAALFSSIRPVIRERNPIYFLSIPFAFASLHFSYGVGSVMAVFKLLNEKNSG